MDIREVMDRALGKTIVQNDTGYNLVDQNKGDFKDFADAFLSDDLRKEVFLSAMSDTAKKFMTLQLSQSDKTEAMEAVSLSSFYKPMMAVIYLGYQVGREQEKGGSELSVLEKMFNSKE